MSFTCSCTKQISSLTDLCPCYHPYKYFLNSILAVKCTYFKMKHKKCNPDHIHPQGCWNDLLFKLPSWSSIIWFCSQRISSKAASGMAATPWRPLFLHPSWKLQSRLELIHELSQNTETEQPLTHPASLSLTRIFLIFLALSTS